MSSWDACKGKIHAAAFDFSSAFDLVDPVMLDNKLLQAGIGPKAMIWLRSYMAGGTMSVRRNKATGTPFRVTRGVRQGSLLGPLLFIILTSDVPLVLDGCTLYADDTTTWSPTADRLERAAANMVHTADTLGLALNASKTQHVVFRGGNKCLKNAMLTVGDQCIRAQDQLDFLGWSVDNKLNPAPFLNKQISALKSRLYLMQRLSAKVPPAVLGPVARAIFNGKASCAVEHSHPVRLEDTNPLPGFTSQQQVVHNDMVRVILRKRRRDHIYREDLAARAGIPSVNALVFSRAAMLAWQAMREPAHPAAGEFKSRILTMSTRAAVDAKLRPPAAGSKALAMVSAVRIWNHFPELRTVVTRSAAETLIKKLAKKIPF